MKTKRLYLYVLALFMSIANAWAGLPALGTTKTGTPENGKKYYIYADTYKDGAYVNRYLYNDNGTLKMNAAVDETSDYYVWTCAVTNGKYTFQNVGDNTKFLGHKELATAAYNFTLGKANANHEGTTIWSDGAGRYLVAKNDGSSFDQSTGTYNQTSGDWCTDYVFVEYVVPEGNTLSITTNFAGGGQVLINGTATALPYTKFASTLSLPLTLTATANDLFVFEGFYINGVNQGKECTIETLSENIAVEARYSLGIFSESFENGVPVQIYNTGNTNYAIKMNSQNSYSGQAVNSGTIGWGKNETWILVGNASSFKMYNSVAGKDLAVKLAGTSSGSAATLVAANEATNLCITTGVEAGKFAISPAGYTDQSFNMHGGAGANIKLYATSDGNSKWNFRKIDLSKKATINYTTAFEGGKFVGNNNAIGYIKTVIGDITTNNLITKTSTFTSGDCYFPANAVFSMSSDPYHGWTITINGGAGVAEQTIPAEGLTIDVNIAANPSDIYQYLYTTPDANGKPYRIPAIAAAPNGTIFAISDNRPCGNDIGYGEVDIKCRMSNDNGATWGEEFFVADGQGGDSNVMTTGYGDAAIVADRIENKLLVMMVCGKTVCHDGRWTPEKSAEADAVNRVARVYATYNESSKTWEWSQPEEVTNSIYSLFLKDGNPTVTSMFIGSGRIAQSSKIKVGDYYRLYCSMWTRDGGNRVIYSDDFGGSWNILGTVDDRPAPGGDEPKCEELPDGSVLLSSRKYNGRYFNVYKYTNTETAEGSWTGVVATNEVGDLAWGGNSTNGEALLVGNVLFQSAPTGSGRSDVSVFYKVLSNNPDDYTPTKLSSGWTEIEISHRGSAYSAMCILPDKENIGLLYEEEPGGYSIVYRPLILKDLLTPEAYEATSALPPTYATEKSPVWHNIKFGATGNVLFDQGAGQKAATATAEEENDACMWNIVGTKDGFYLVSKLGNYLAYDEASARYITTADKKQKAALILKENIKGSWEIMRKGSDKSLCEVAVNRSIYGEISEATICGDANQIAFTDLTPEIYDPNIFSTEKSPVWFQVQFKAGGCYIADQGAGNNLLTKASNSEDAQFWQFIGKPESFYMKSRSGNYVYYTNNRFATNATEKTELRVIKNAAEGYYEIGRVGSSNNYMNQHGGAGADKQLGEWGAGDTNNPLRFIQEEIEVEKINYFSTEDAPQYWWIQFNKGGAFLADQGAGNNAITANKAYTDAQLWQLVGSESSFYLKNKAGRYLSWTGSRFATSATESDKATLILHETSRTDAEGCYEIQLSGNSYMNQNGGAGADKELGTWNAGDENNPIKFISAEVTYPTFSTDTKDYWYFIQFGNGNYTIEDKGAGNNVLTSALDDLDTQKWKLTGTKENCQIINKEGRYLVYQNSRIKASTSPDAQGFKLVPTTNSNYPLYLEIQHLSTENKAFNMHGGSGKGKEIALYDSNDGGNPLKFVAEADVVYPEFKVEASNAAAPEEKLTLWYTQPATATGVSNTWMEYSLPLGNGQFGASLFGGVAKDEILFNEKTLWSGGPNSYGEYLPFGSIYIEDISGNFTYNSTKPIKNYYRDLNLNTATGTVTYEDFNGVKYTRQYIVSNPDKAAVTRITASEAGKLNLRFTMESGKPTVKAETTYNNGYATFSGKLQTVSYNATMRVIAKGGYTSTGADGIIVEEADEVLVILAGSTDFAGENVSHNNGKTAQLGDDNLAIVNAVATKGWDAVYADHVADHQEFFNRVTLELDGVENNVPTNELITVYNNTKDSGSAYNLMLEQLYYNYGRYLSIASSRGVALPNNLQGIWNNTCSPPWHSDIHANINVQMNYWPVSAGNLNEMYEPFLNYIINEAAQPEWRALASNAVTSLNNTLGTTTAAREDGWTCLTENNIFGGISGFAPNYVIANAWYVTHMWQHYRYTLDKEYLTRAFPAMKGSSLFWADRMVLAADGKYECPNEYSPEHGPGSENAVAHAQQIAWESIDNTIKAADVLGAVEKGLISQEDYNLLKDRLEKMDRGLAIEQYEAHTEYKTNDEGEKVVAYSWPAERNGIKTGDNIIREWKYSRFYASGDQGHRHMSHLMALFPFGQLTPADEELFDAAINSMKLRGDESTGWSMGWKINLWARALMPDRAHTILKKALKHSTSYGTDQGQGGIYYNLYDSHAPFQIDGNFGATSGINEMLLQSHTDVIDILPALPAAWSNGSVKGLKAVGDFTVSIEWENNKAQKVTIINNQGQPCYVKYGDRLHLALVTVNGVATTFSEEKTVNGLKCYQIASNAGDEIVIDLTSATIQDDKSELEELIAATEELVGECYDYYTEAAPLQVENADAAYYLSTNADHNVYNSTKDGQGIGALVDDSDDTYLHTNWSANKENDITEAHRLDVDLGENAISSFKFKYRTRKTDTDFIKTMEVYGYNSEGEYELITTITGLPTGSGSQTKEYKSPVIKGDEAYSKLRFVVTETNTNKSASGQRYFHMAEFDLMLYSAESPVPSYPESKFIPAAVEKANNEIADANVALNTEQTVAQYNASLAELQAAYDELAAAIASGNLPVLLTTDANKPVVYKIGLPARGDNKVLKYDLDGANLISVVDYSEGNTLQGWYFTKGSTGEQVFIHPYVGGGDVLASNNVGDNHSRVEAVVKNSEGYMQEWTIHTNDAENGIYNIRPTSGNTYFSNIYGTGYKMGFYNSANDNGSKFTFTGIDFEGELWYNTLNTYKTTLCAKESVVEGTSPGQYINGNAYNTARAAAVEALADEASTEEELKNAYTELRAAREAMEFVSMKENRYYTINCEGNYITGNLNTDGKIAMSSTKDATAIFYYDGEHLLSYSSGLYIGLNSSDWGFEAVGSEDISVIELTEGSVAGTFAIKCGGRWLHSNETFVNRCQSNTCGAAHSWAFEEVTSLPVTITSAGYATFYAPVEVSANENVEAYYTTGEIKESKYLQMIEIESGVIPAEQGVILKLKDAAAAGTYNLDINYSSAGSEELTDNLFVGTKERALITKEENNSYYVLGLDSKGVVGLYNPTSNIDGKFYNSGHKSYLVIGDANQTAGYSFGFDWNGTTGIEDIDATEENGAKNIFDLQGRKLKEISAPGFYIVDGQKVFIK